MTHISPKYRKLIGALLIIGGAAAIFLVAGFILMPMILKPIYNAIVAGMDQKWWYGYIESASITLISTLSILFYSKYIIKKFLRNGMTN